MNQELPQYQCHKKVRACKIQSVAPGRSDGNGPGGRIIPSDRSLIAISVSESYLNKHNPEPGGYYVLYEDGYESYSPAASFESGYTLI